jgi:hypothetical protein
MTIPSRTSAVKFQFGHKFGIGMRIITISTLVVFGCLFWLVGFSGLPLVLLYSCFAFIIFSSLCIFQTVLLVDDRKILRTYKFLGIFLFWRRLYELDSFSAVQLRRYPGAEDDKIMVGLLSKDGSFFGVQTFLVSARSSSCPEAETCRLRLAELSGLNVADDIED